MVSMTHGLLFCISILLVQFGDVFAFGYYGEQGTVPRPIMTLHSGHIGLSDQLMITEYSGTVQTGQPYTLDIYMGNTDRYDYVIERCLYNTRSAFLDNYGCLRRDNVFLQKWETSDYTIPGALKRTLVHFVAAEPIVNFDCQIKVIECCGCAEASCERQPPLTYYPVYPVPLVCTWPGTMQQPGTPIGGGSAVGFYRGNNFWGGIPWWLWLLLLILLILAILLCCCGICFLLARRNKKKKNTTMLVKTATGPPPPPPIAPKPKMEATVQTVPETRQASQQVNLDTSIRRQTTHHAEIPLTDTKPRQVIHTIYDEDLVLDDHHHGASQPDHYINFGADFEHDYEHQHQHQHRERDYHKYGAVPVHRGNSLQQQYELQSEIESRLRRDQERQNLEHRIESHLAEHRERRELRHYEVEPTVETLREETIHTMRQTSAI
uniref:ZP domain-containing protein n=1 Tax=Panagrellus redivivus TaxID=6233 RepID=A0A7E4UYG6_PANRE